MARDVMTVASTRLPTAAFIKAEIRYLILKTAAKVF